MGPIRRGGLRYGLGGKPARDRSAERSTYRGRLRDLRVGLYHGAYCVGCCWGLMIVLITVGVMNLPWMVGLAAVIFIEKTSRYGKAFSVVFGISLLAFACFVPWRPSLVPGLYMAGAM